MKKSEFRHLIFITIGLLSLLATLNAKSQTVSTKIHNQYNSLRALGMGNAFTAVPDDYSMLFYNPGGFGFKKDGEIQVSLGSLAFGGKIDSLVKEISDAEKSVVDENDKVTAISAVLDKYYGEPFGTRFQLIEVFWTRPNWGFAVLPVDFSMDLTVNKQLGPAIDLDLKKDTTFAFGYGQKLDDEISVGGTLKAIHRGSVSQSIPALELASNSNVMSEERFKEGISIDVDAGVMYRPRWFGSQTTERNPAQTTTPTAATPAEDNKLGLEVKDETAANPADGKTPEERDPKLSDSSLKEQVKKDEAPPETVTEYKTPLTLSAVLRNVLGGQFAKSTILNKKATEAPEKLPMVLDVGSSYELMNFGFQTVMVNLDFRNLNHPAMSQFMKGTHAGIEYRFAPSGYLRFDARAGFNQGYYTFGLGLMAGVFSLDALTFAEEVGTSSTKQEARQYAVKIGFWF